MFRLSKKTDYALLALHYLASEEASGVASTRMIAERFDIPGELLAKILQQLARDGFVAAHKGVQWRIPPGAAGACHLCRAGRAGDGWPDDVHRMFPA
jgi:DNA-binding IclR family transcriptional regulator